MSAPYLQPRLAVKLLDGAWDATLDVLSSTNTGKAHVLVASCAPHGHGRA